MRTLLFTGKGGVGKTTLAAATAVKAAADGHKVLVVSTDPAHSLGDALGVRLSGSATEVVLPDARSAVHAAEIHGGYLAEQTWSELRKYLRTMLHGAGVGEIDADELTVLPGVEDLLALAEVHRFASSDEWDAVIVDCGPTAETLRLLALPEALRGYLDRLFPEHHRVVRGTLARIAGSDQVHRWNDVADALSRLVEQLTGLRDMLTAADTGVRLVCTADSVVAAETRRTLTALALHQLRVDALVVNRLVPHPGAARGQAAAWMRGRRSEQDRVLSELRAATDLPVRTVQHRPDSPVGAGALLDLAERMYPVEDEVWGGDPLCGLGTMPEMRVVGSGTGLEAEYSLCLGLSLGPEAQLELARIGDELAITIDGRRRLIALPAVLRRCVVVSATAGDDGVTVAFRPNPELWMR